MRLIFSCEHGGNRVPAAYRRRFEHAGHVLNSHRGFDAGSLELARWLSRELTAPLFAVTVTRLLVELNRSIGHPALFSEFTRGLDRDAKATILDRYYYPHRRQVEAAVAQHGCVLHVGVHSFSPEIGGDVRRADIGILYDPSRTREQNLGVAWQKELARRRPDLIVRRNYPYLGKSDGFTTTLRRRFPPAQYLGMELEVNQRWTARPRIDRRALAAVLAETLGTAMRLV